MRSIDTFFDHEQDYPDLDGQGAAERLSRAVQCKTINCADHSLTDYAPFDQLHALIRSGYPHVMAWLMRPRDVPPKGRLEWPPGLRTVSSRSA